MALTPSGRFKNWVSATFTPAGREAITILGVVSCTADRGTNKVKGSGDNDQYLSTIATDVAEPKITIQTNKPAALDFIDDGAEGVFTIIRCDAKNGAAAGGGAMKYTLNPCTFDGGDQNGSYRQFGMGTATFLGWSADGVTDPFSSAAV
jgi:hypothetical protein